MAILSLIPEGDPDLNTYLNKPLRTKKLDRQNNTFWFLTAKIPGKPEDHTPIQTRILRELLDLNGKEKRNPEGDTEAWTKVFERFDWTDTLLTKTEKRAIEVFLVDSSDIFARNRMDIGMNAEFKVNVVPKTMELYTVKMYPRQFTWKWTELLK